MDIRDLVELLELHSKKGDLKCAMKQLFKWVMDKVQISDYNCIDAAISEFIKRDFDLQLYVSFLSITNGIKHKLNIRNELHAKAYDLAHKVVKDENQIKRILDGF